MVGVAIVAGFANRDRLRLKIASVTPSVAPKSAQAPPPSKRKSSAFSGEAPWALSALPECFQQTSKSTGPRAYVLAHLPAGSAAVVSGESLTFSDCTVNVRGEAIDVQRGADRLRVPPPARLYRSGTVLSILRGNEGGYELRTYLTGESMKL